MLSPVGAFFRKDGFDVLTVSPDDDQFYEVKVRQFKPSETRLLTMEEARAKLSKLGGDFPGVVQILRNEAKRNKKKEEALNKTWWGRLWRRFQWWRLDYKFKDMGFTRANFQ